MNTDKMIETGCIPLNENGSFVYGYKDRNINYCVVSRYKNIGSIENCLAHMMKDDLSNIAKKSEESLSPLDMDK